MLMDVVIDCQRQQPNSTNNGAEYSLDTGPKRFSVSLELLFSHSINHLKYNTVQITELSTKQRYRLLMHFLLFEL